MFTSQEVNILMNSKKEIIASLFPIWKKSPIMKIFIPDWYQYKIICDKPYDLALFESILITAERINKLDDLLNIFNKFCFDDNKNKIITKQYEKDLNELIWLFANDETERYKKANIYLGKIVEFLLAHYLLEQSYEIINMQAWDKDSPDIVVYKDNKKINIEVKWIGQYKKEFENFLNGINSGFCNILSANDNLIKKIKQAAANLKKESLEDTKIAAIVMFTTAPGNYFIGQETCCRTDEEVINYQNKLYNTTNLDEVRIFSLNGIQIKHWYTFDIKNQKFYNIKSK